MKHKYQLHTHTATVSKCGRTTPEELAVALHNAGYAGCVLTNHFYHGNTGINRELSWNEFVSEYEKNYLECKRQCEKYGLDIIFGVEESVGGGREILCYGITPKMLYDHPELIDKSYELWYKTLHALGVVVIQAHPYRVRGYITDPGILPLEFIDGIEVYNYANLPEHNAEAEAFAKENPHLILTAGADTHVPETVGFSGIETDARIKNGKKLCEILKSGKYKIIK